MVVKPVRPGDLDIVSTFIATPWKHSQEQEFYLSREINTPLGNVLAKLTEGDRETARAFCCALYAEFMHEFPAGTLKALVSYLKDRAIWFELEQGQLSRLIVYKQSTQKQIVTLGVTKDLQGDAITQLTLPRYPFSYTPSRYS